MSPFCSQTAITPRVDGRPTQGQAASVCANSSVSCAALCCKCACVFLCVRLLADLCMPLSGFCVMSRKSQEKQNWTFCKQPVTNFWSVCQTLYLHYQLCFLGISCFQWGRSAQIQYCLCGPRQMVYVVANCVPVPATARRRKHSYKMFDPKFICCCTYTILQYGLEQFLCLTSFALKV